MSQNVLVGLSLCVVTLAGGELWRPILQLQQSTPYDILGECLLHARHNVNGRLRGHLLPDRHWQDLHGLLHSWCLGESSPIHWSLNLKMYFCIIPCKYRVSISW